MENHNFTEIFVYQQGSNHIDEGFSPNDLPGLLADPTNVIWVDIRGEDQNNWPAIKDILLNTFKFHYLTVEDCLETRNAPTISPLDRVMVGSVTSDSSAVSR